MRVALSLSLRWVGLWPFCSLVENVWVENHYDATRDSKLDAFQVRADSSEI